MTKMTVGQTGPGQSYMGRSGGNFCSTSMGLGQVFFLTSVTASNIQRIIL